MMKHNEWDSETSVLNALPCGCVITDLSRTILHANEYLGYHFRLDHMALHGSDLATILTKASQLFFESYAVPMLEHEGSIEEIQLNVQPNTREPVPAVINAKLFHTTHRIYWCLFPTVRRDQLIQELNEAHRALEERASSLHSRAITDPLTGVLNRTEMDIQTEHFIVASQRTGTPISLMLVDIDHFKQVNDRFGHAAGDHVLQLVAAALTHNSRDADVAFRYGGDEFVVLLHNTPAQEAERVAGRLHQRIDNLHLDIGPITISIGIATADGHELLEYTTLREVADRALYQAKRNGRAQTAILQSA